MAVFPTAGTKIYIGSIMVDVDTDYAASDFSGLTYVEIGNTTNLGTFGDAAAAITADEIGRPRVRKAKGSRNAGTLSLTCLKNPADAGQIACIAAEQTYNNYAFKIVYPDLPTAGGSPHATTQYFAAKVQSMTDNAGGANQFVSIAFTLDIDSNIVTVAAAGT